MKIIIIGPPGSGKDTIADNLKATFGWESLTPGAIFRKEAQLKTVLGLEARDKYWGKGNLCPDEMVNQLVKNELQRINYPEQIVFNGYPRSLGQAEYLQSLHTPDLVLDLVVDEDVAVKRLLTRKREDDIEDVIRIRFADYNKNNLPIIEYYKGIMVYTAVDGNKTIEEVNNEVLNIIGE